MKVLLVQPKKPPKTFGGDDLTMFEPLALEYLAGAIKHEHEVKILDLRIEDTLEATINCFRPDVVGITAYTVHVNVVNRMCEKIKLLNREIVVVVGGHHASVRYQDFVSPYIDLIVVGEGGFTFQQALSRIENKESFDGIAGVVYKEGNRLVKTDPLSYELDDLPLPDRSFTKKYRRRYSSEWMKPLALVRTSKGCPFSCSFCALWNLTGGKYLVRSPDAIVDELRQVEEPCIFFADDESFIQVGRMMELAEKIEAAGIEKRYYLYVRADTTARHPELLQVWKRIGLERVFVGFEFFRDEDLKAVHKGGTAEKNVKAIEIIKSLDINLLAAFIIRPDFDKRDFRDLAQFCRDYELDFAGISVLTPLPGTALYKEVQDRLIIRNYDYYDFVHTLVPTKLPIKEFYDEFLQLVQSTRSNRNSLRMLKMYSPKDLVTDLPFMAANIVKYYYKFGNIYKDYHDLDAINAAQIKYPGMPTCESSPMVPSKS